MRKQPECLHIGFVRASGFSSRVIEWFGSGFFSHVTTRQPSNPLCVIDARSDTVEGVPPGVRVRPIHYLKDYEVVWLALPCALSQLHAIERALLSQVGKPYGFADIWDFALGRVRLRDWAAEDDWFCSELEIWSLVTGGRCGKLPLSPNFITPGAASLIVGALGAYPIDLVS